MTFCLIKILKKISEWPKCIEASSLRLEPHRIPIYLYELSSKFHSYWNMGKEDESKRFINNNKTISKIFSTKTWEDVINDYYDINLKYARLASMGINKEEIEMNKLVQSSSIPSYRFVKLELAEKDHLLNLILPKRKFHKKILVEDLINNLIMRMMKMVVLY